MTSVQQRLNSLSSFNDVTMTGLLPGHYHTETKSTIATDGCRLMPTTHEVENRRRYSEPIFVRRLFRSDHKLSSAEPQKTNMADQVYGDAFAPNFNYIAGSESRKGKAIYNC